MRAIVAAILLVLAGHAQAQTGMGNAPGPGYSPMSLGAGPGQATWLPAIGLNVSAFGAVCNSTVDDRVAIQAAATAAQAIAGTVYFPGMCRTTAAISVTGPVSFTGSGWSTGLLIDAAVDGIDVNTTAAISISNMTIQYSSAFANAANTNAINITAPLGSENTGSYVNYINFFRAYTAINTGRASRFVFSNNFVHSEGGTIRSTASSGVRGAAGAGYTSGAQVLTLSGIACDVLPSFNVTVVANAVTTVNSVANAGSCMVAPGTPIATTGGGGTGATITVTWSGTPVNATYGFQIRNTNNEDSGDSSVFANNIQGVLSDCILWQSSGGTKMFGNKLNGCNIGVRVLFNSTKSTGDIFVNSNSIEGVLAACFYLSRQGGVVFTLSHITFNDNECSTAAIGLQVVNDAGGQWITNVNYQGGNYQGGNSTIVAAIDSTNIFSVGNVTIYSVGGGPLYPASAGAAASNGVLGPFACNNCFPANINPSATNVVLVATSLGGEQTCSLLPFFGGAAVTLDPSSICSYDVVDKRVTVNFYLVITAKGGTGAFSIQGLPFAANASGANLGAMGPLMVAANGVSIPAAVFVEPGPGTSILSVFTQLAANRGGLTDTNFGACSGGSPCTLIGNINYFR